jgi:hypothetical protein
MKFRDKLELEVFLTEINRLDLMGQIDESFVPTVEMEESFIKRRKSLTGALKSFRRSQQTKEQWRKNRWGFMKGIKKFARSVEGKRFHRNLGRFLSSRYFNPTMKSIISLDREQDDKSSRSVKEELNIFELAEILKAVTSAKTHILIELEYYMPLDEEVDYWEFLDEIIPALDTIEKKLWLSERLDDGDLEVIFRLTEKNELIKALSEFSGIKYKEIEEFWNEFESSANMEEDVCMNLIRYIGGKHGSVGSIELSEKL